MQQEIIDLDANKFREFLAEMIARNTGGLNGLFDKYNISAPLNPDNLAAAGAHPKFGKAFQQDLYRVYREIKAREPNALIYNNGAIDIDEGDSFFNINSLLSNDGSDGITESGENTKGGFWKNLDGETFTNLFDKGAGLLGQVNVLLGKTQTELTNEERYGDQESDPTGPTNSPNASKGFDLKWSNPLVKIGTLAIVLIITAIVIKRYNS